MSDNDELDSEHHGLQKKADTHIRVTTPLHDP